MMGTWYFQAVIIFGMNTYNCESLHGNMCSFLGYLKHIYFF